MGGEASTDETAKSESAALIERLMAENGRFQEELKALKQQQDSLNAAMTMMLSSKDDEISNLKRKFEEECASYQRLMEEAVEAAVEECNHDWQTRYAIVEDECTFLKKQVEELKQRLRLREFDRTNAGMTSRCSEDRAHLQSIIEPMEQEIDSLRKKLGSAERKLSAFGFPGSPPETPSDKAETTMNQHDQSSLKDESISETVGLCEQLECYKIQLELERKHREEAENKLSECALTGLTESTKQQCRMDELEREIQALEIMYRQLSTVSEARIAELIDKCLTSKYTGRDVDATLGLARLEARLETERLRHRRTVKRLLQNEEELVLMRSVESEYQRLLDRNKELEAECMDLKRQIEVGQQATFRAINTIRSEVERRCKQE